MSVDLQALADDLTPPEGLSALLARLVERQAARDVVAGQLKQMEKELEELESQAAESLGASGLDGCRVAGKTWWVDEALRLSLTKDKREALIEAAEAEGLEDAVTVNNATVKSWLTERAKESGCPLEDAVKGTRFEGLVGQFVEVRLRSRTLA
jgi:hypothetical protein